MNNSESISYKIWEHVEAQNTKIGKRVLHWLNYDNLNDVILDNGIFWFEYRDVGTVPNYVHEYLKAYYKRLGYKYLFEIK